ncbi:helix-turn-helix transcriptional regulator [Allokutzneria albata]|uniref:Regulatory protein, luxR family n=1 Tax=Allokutzneria albata TaxID=211114 RepID=A0A1G9TT16_ALLAB|nr:LuxR family transcriptional regulator [Allokutzneria albata]SDM50863.1 regulatory protein, luxR family [Allokutzneria albata]
MVDDGVRDGGRRTGPSRFVGRATEVAALTARARSALSGRSAAVLLRGPAGIGKTRLLDDLLPGLALEHRATVLRVDCREVNSAIGYGAVRALFAPLGITGEDDPRLAASARWALPALVTDENAAADELGGTPSYRVLHGLYWLVVTIAAEAPLVLVLDDAHWCDESSLHWLDFLLRRAEGLPLLVVLAHRTETRGAGSPGLDALLAHARCTSMDLGPLTTEEIGTLAVDVLGGVPTPAFLRACAEVSGGNPLLTARLLGELRRDGAVPDDTAVARVEVVGRDVLASSVLLRLAGLPEHARAVARGVAVLGGVVPGGGAELVSVLAGVQARLVHMSMEALRRNEVLHPTELDFVHDEVRSAVLGATPAEEVTRLRVRAARLLNDAGRPAEEVANQLMLLVDLPEQWMLGVLTDAAVHAEQRGAPDAAVSYLNRVLQHTDQLPVRVQLARCLAHSDPAGALEQLGHVLTLNLDARQRAEVTVQYGLTALAMQRAPEATKLLGDTLAELSEVVGPDPGPADRDLRTRLWSALLFIGSDEKSTMPVLRELARRMPLPDGETPAEREVLAMASSLAAVECKPVEHAVELARRALRGPSGGMPRWAVLNAAFTLHMADKTDEALAAFGSVLEDSRAHANLWSYCMTLASRAVLYHSIGELSEFAADTHTALAVFEQEPWDNAGTVPWVGLAVSHLERAELDEAEAALARVRTDRIDDLIWEGPHYLMASAKLRWRRGDLDGALARLSRCAAILDESGIANPLFTRWWVDVACIRAEQGQQRQAREVVERAQDLAQQWGTLRGVGLGLLAEGVLAEPRRAVRVLAEAVDVLSATPARLDLAHALCRLGQASLFADDAKGAREHLRGALDLATRCGSQVLANEAGRLLVLAGGRLRKEIRSPIDGLTGSERRVAVMAAEGNSNREIAESLFVTVRTVEVHLTNVYRKLGLSRRAELPGALARTPAPEKGST